MRHFTLPLLRMVNFQIPLTPRSRSIVSAGPISPSTPGRFATDRRNLGTYAEDSNNNPDRDSLSDSETSGEDTPAVSPSHGTREASSVSPNARVDAHSTNHDTEKSEPLPLLRRSKKNELPKDMQLASSTAVVVFDEQATIAAGFVVWVCLLHLKVPICNRGPNCSILTYLRSSCTKFGLHPSFDRAHETIPLVLESETSTVGFGFTSNGGCVCCLQRGHFVRRPSSYLNTYVWVLLLVIRQGHSILRNVCDAWRRGKKHDAIVPIVALATVVGWVDELK